MKSLSKSIPISCWAAEDIPSVKANNMGYNSLSNAELLSIVIGSGTITENAVELSRRLLVESGNSLKRLSKMRIKDLTAINGIGEIKASKILAALELAERKSMEKTEERPTLNSATSVYHYMHPRIGMLDMEEFWVVFMNQKFRLIQAKRISHGGMTEVLADIRVIIREAVLCNSTVIAAVHNHPSGSVSPSKDDDKLTETLKNACQLMRIHFLDHVIVVDGSYYSYRESGRL